MWLALMMGHSPEFGHLLSGSRRPERDLAVSKAGKPSLC